jgi:hypothetical protein
MPTGITTFRIKLMLTKVSVLKKRHSWALLIIRSHLNAKVTTPIIIHSKFQYEF